MFPAPLERLKVDEPRKIFSENFELFQASNFISILLTFGSHLGSIFDPFSDILVSFSATSRNSDFVLIFEWIFHRFSFIFDVFFDDLFDLLQKT